MEYNLLQGDFGQRNDPNKDHNTNGNGVRVAFCQEDVRCDFIAYLLAEHCKASNCNKDVKGVLGDTQQSSFKLPLGYVQ